MEAMRVLLVDNHVLFREGLARILTSQPHMQVVGEAGDGLEALEKTKALQPDLVITDIRLPRCDGLETTRLIKSLLPATKVVILTVSEEDGDLFEAIKVGADGYLLKSLSAEEFITLLEGVARGEVAITRSLASRVLREFATIARGAPKQPALSRREREILRMVAEGASNKMIASDLYVTENTVKYHLSNILKKLNLRNRAQAAAYAIREGLVEQPRR